MKINIYTKLNGVGLEADARILNSYIADHDILTMDWTQPVKRKADIGIHLEHIRRELMPLAKVNIAMPNPEWFEQQWIPLLPHIDAVFCKTQFTQQLFSKYHKAAIYSGFTSEDKYMSGVDKRIMFLHLAGKSSHKGSEFVRDCWRGDDNLPLLYFQKLENVVPFVLSQKKNNYALQSNRVPDIREIMNMSAFHLCPSKAEGFGHYINEAMSAGAIVITTDAAPMNELVNKDCGFLVPAFKCGQHRLSPEMCVAYNELKRAVNECAAMSPERINEMSANARQTYLQRDKEFRIRINQLINAI